MKRIATLLLFLLHTIANGQNYTVQLQSGTFLPPEKSIILPGATEAVEGLYYRVIQFYQIPTEVQKASLEAKGIKLYNYLPNYCYMAAIPAQFELGQLANNTLIRSVFPIAPKHKLTPDLAAGEIPSYVLRGKGNVELIVLHHPTLRSAVVATWLESNNISILHTLADQHAFRIIAKTTDIEKLAAAPHLYFIEPSIDNPEPENLVGTTSHRSNFIATDGTGDSKYDGTGVNVALNDDGVIGAHIDYTGRIINQYISFNNGNHGDHCAGTIFGAGNINPTTKGMASGAKLGVYGVSGSFASVYQAFDSITNHYNTNNIRIISTSYGDGNNTGYTSRARLMDVQINTMPQLMHVFSAGNSGTSNFNYGAGAGWGNITGGHKQAKNVITVGNLNARDTLASSSSRGPARDGRIKPDVCAVGVSVLSTVNTNTYLAMTGTSMACPGVAGVLAQLNHAYKDLNNNIHPPSALIKATLLNTADDIGNPGPDYRHGYGRVNARRALGVLQNNQYLFDSVSQGNTKTHTIAVPANVAELRVMVYWHDKEATAGVSKALVNNLNMTVTTPTSTVVNPWVLNPTPTAAALNANATQGIDTLNNMEQVTIPSPAAGNYTVSVNGFGVPFGPQRYVVVYEFVTNEITVTYPKGGESLVPGVQETIRWDAYGNTGTFTVAYSTNNGGAWSTIGTVAAALRHLNWTPPSGVTGQALIRVTRGTVSDQSDATFSVIGVPTGLTVDWVCLDSFKVSYNPVAGATGYIVTVLGTEYMDSVAFSNTTSCVVRGINTTVPGWFSVQAVGPNNCTGRRALALQRVAVPFNCVLPDDLGTVAINSPSDSTVISCQNPSVSQPVSVQIANNSGSPLSNTQVKYSVNGGTPVVENYPGALASLTTVTHTFAQPLVLTGAGTYNIKVWVENTADSTNLNDTIVLQKRLIQPALATLPLFEYFETFTPCDTSANCETGDCIMTLPWYNALNTVDDDIDWRISSGPTPTNATLGTTGPSMDMNPGTITGQYAYLEASNCTGKTASLIAPCIDLNTAVSPLLRVGYHMFGSGIGSLHVDALINGQWSNDIVPPISGPQGNSWQTLSVPLSSYKGQIISLRIRGVTGSNEESDIAIDNIRIVDVAGTQDISQQLVSVYPNPSGGIFTIQFARTAIDATLKVADITGKTIMEMKPTGNTTTIDLSKFTSGVYLLTVATEEGVTTKKLIKQ